MAPAGAACRKHCQPRGAGRGCPWFVVLAADRTVRRLNARHRGQNRPTNVLTYTAPAHEMVLALGVIRREAAAAGRRPAHHLAHLVVHGALHLAGHDHHHPGEARRMELAEARILHRLRRAQSVEAGMSDDGTPRGSSLLARLRQLLGRRQTEPSLREFDRRVGAGGGRRTAGRR